MILATPDVQIFLRPCLWRRRFCFYFCQNWGGEEIALPPPSSPFQHPCVWRHGWRSKTFYNGKRNLIFSWRIVQRIRQRISYLWIFTNNQLWQKKLQVTNTTRFDWLSNLWNKIQNFIQSAVNKLVRQGHGGLIKFSFSEKATKIWVIFPIVLRFTVNVKDCANFCGLLRKAEL